MRQDEAVHRTIKHGCARSFPLRLYSRAGGFNTVRSPGNLAERDCNRAVRRGSVMKQFIVLAAILPILLLFVAQSALAGVRGLRMNAAEDAVRAFCIEAAYFDGGGQAEANALREKLGRIFKAEPAEVYLTLSYADAAHIEWNLSFPVGDIMAGASFLGLTAAENRGRAQMSGVIVVAPKPPPPQVIPPETGDSAESEKIEEEDEEL